MQTSSNECNSSNNSTSSYTQMTANTFQYLIDTLADLNASDELKLKSAQEFSSNFEVNIFLLLKLKNIFLYSIEL